VSKAFAIPTGPAVPVDGVYDWSQPVPLYLWAACDDIVTPFDLAYDAFQHPSPPKFFFQSTGAHGEVVLYPDGTDDAFVDRYVAGDQSPVLLETLLGAAADPGFAFDVGRVSRLTVPPCHPAPGAVPSVDVVEVVPALTG
jgi:hypothetical protein